MAQGHSLSPVFAAASIAAFFWLFTESWMRKSQRQIARLLPCENGQRRENAALAAQAMPPCCLRLSAAPCFTRLFGKSIFLRAERTDSLYSFCARLPFRQYEICAKYFRHERGAANSRSPIERPFIASLFALIPRAKHTGDLTQARKAGIITGNSGRQRAMTRFQAAMIASGA